MTKLLTFKEEIEAALVYLRRPSHHHRFERAANRLEFLSQSILNPTSKAKRPKTQRARIRGGSGREYPIKIMVEDE